MIENCDIVICGYPKSGTTWLSRLLAELVGCPLKGNWGFGDQSAQDVERLDRKSSNACYKSHHRLADLMTEPTERKILLVYIIRDPRDVAVSAAHHFDMPISRIRQHFGPQLAKVTGRLMPHSYRRARLINAVLAGDPSISEWLSESWRSHYLPFLNAGTHFTQFERLLEDPVPTCRDLLNHIDFRQSDEHIQAAINRQSFPVRKKEFLDNDQQYQYRFLRRGGSNYWRNEFSNKQKALFYEILGDDLDYWSYPPN